LRNIVSLIGIFAKETYNFKEPTERSHPIAHSWPCSNTTTVKPCPQDTAMAGEALKAQV